MLKKIIHPDSNMISNYSFRKTANMRSYAIKSVTDTLLTMKSLYDKWMFYDTDICSRYFEKPETNQHLWDCSKSKDALNNITQKLATIHRLPLGLKHLVVLMAQDILMTRLTEFLKAKTYGQLILSTDKTPTLKDIMTAILITLRNIIKIAFDLI
jgi:hypothetical protein